jgi:hypothetical protein
MKLPLATSAAVALLSIVATAQSDVPLEGEALARFEATKGAAFVGRDVRWEVPSKSLMTPKRARRGYELYLRKGVGILVESSCVGLEEVRRRGGIAILRGGVRATSEAERAEGAPEHVVVVRSITYKRRSAPKKRRSKLGPKSREGGDARRRRANENAAAEPRARRPRGGSKGDVSLTRGAFAFDEPRWSG